MALTLNEMAESETNFLRLGVTRAFVENSTVLEDLPFVQLQEGSARFFQEETRMVTFGGVVDVSMTKNTLQFFEDTRAMQTRLKVKKLATGFTKEFFEGDSELGCNSFDGLRKRLTGEQVITASSGTNNGDILELEYIDRLIDSVWGGPDVIYMNRANRRALVALAQKTGLLYNKMDFTGKVHTYYDEIPIKVLDRDDDGKTLLGFNEKVGFSDNCSSIYAVRYGEEFVCGITKGLVVEDLGLLENPKVYRTLIEWYAGITINNPKSAARLQGIKFEEV